MISSIAILIVLVFMGWFAVGVQWNIRKGNILLRWLQGGLPLLGKRTTLRWLGSSVVELKITQPLEPFLDVEVVIVLEPRDVGALWVWGRLHGRRDFLILRARLEQPPQFEAEVGDRRGWTGHDALRRLTLSEWRQANWKDPNVQIAYSGGRASEEAQRLWTGFQNVCGGIWRLSIRRTTPHLEVHLLPPAIGSVQADRLVQTFLELSHTVMKLA